MVYDLSTKSKQAKQKGGRRERGRDREIRRQKREMSEGCERKKEKQNAGQAS